MASFTNYAVEMHFLSSGSQDLTKDQLDAITQGMVMMPEQSFEDFNTEIAKLCSIAPCDYSVVAKWNALYTRIQLAKASSLTKQSD